MKELKRILNLKVYLDFGENETLVGELVEDNRLIYFKYSSDFLQSGYELSPFKIPLQSGIVTAPIKPFDGLFGLFDDSLPGGWGRLLLDRKLLQEGTNLNEVSILTRLALIGNRGGGALVYYPDGGDNTFINQQVELDRLSQEMNQVLAGKSEDVLDKLYNLGGSSGGARPKILVGYNSITDHIIPEKTPLPEGYEHWIIKFASATDLFDIAEVEFAYYLMAKSAGIEMSESKLLLGKSGKKYFATKRFDRIGHKRLHLHSAAGLMHDNFRLSSMDYGHLMDAAFFLERDVKAYEKVLRLAAFNIFAHNRDDHSNNFSFLMDEKGKWRFAPAYDLTFSSSSHGMHSTTIAGAGERPNETHLIELANNFGVKDVSKIIDEVKQSINLWAAFCRKSGVSKETQLMIEKYLKS